MAQDEAALSDAFYRDLAFGTGGLRGVIGAGTNHMNVYTVAKASQGLANYVVRRFSPEARRIAVSYDSRIKSDLFARVAAGVFAANGISVFIYPHLMPTPCLSYAVRALGCAAGVMVTASHNPAKYNGYKVYGSDGCQITTEAADEALREIERLDIFADVKQANFDACLADGSIQWIPDSVYDNFTRAVRGQSVLTADDPIDRDVSIVYTPLNGTGLQPVTRALRESGFSDAQILMLRPTAEQDELTQLLQLGAGGAALPDGQGRIVHQRVFNAVGAVRQRVDGRFQLLEQGRIAFLQLRLYVGQRPEAPGKSQQIPAVDGAGDDAGLYPFQIGDVPQSLLQLAPDDDVVRQLLHRAVAAGDLHRVKKGLFQPGAQQPPAHGGVGLIQHPQQRALLFLRAHGLRQFQIPPGVQIQLHEPACGVILQLPDVGKVVFLQGQQGLQQCAAGNDGGGHSRNAHLGKSGMEVIFQQCFRTFQSEQLLLSLADTAIQAAENGVVNDLAVHIGTVAEDFAGCEAAKLGGHVLGVGADRGEERTGEDGYGRTARHVRRVRKAG